MGRFAEVVVIPVIQPLLEAQCWNAMIICHPDTPDALAFSLHFMPIIVRLRARHHGKECDLEEGRFNARGTFKILRV